MSHSLIVQMVLFFCCFFGALESLSIHTYEYDWDRTISTSTRLKVYQALDVNAATLRSIMVLLSNPVSTLGQEWDGLEFSMEFITKLCILATEANRSEYCLLHRALFTKRAIISRLTDPKYQPPLPELVDDSFETFDAYGLEKRELRDMIVLYPEKCGSLRVASFLGATKQSDGYIFDDRIHMVDYQYLHLQAISATLLCLRHQGKACAFKNFICQNLQNDLKAVIDGLVRSSCPRTSYERAVTTYNRLLEPLPQTQKALWHGKLLIAFLLRVLNSKWRAFFNISKFPLSVFEKYLRRFDVREIPPFILDEIMGLVKAVKLINYDDSTVFKIESATFPAMHQILLRYPQHHRPDFPITKSHQISIWKYFLPSAGTLHVPASFLTQLELLEWWSSYDADNLRNIIHVSNILSRPILVTEPRLNASIVGSCRETIDVLNIIKSVFLYYSSTWINEPMCMEAIESQEEIQHLKSAARLFATSILLDEKIRLIHSKTAIISLFKGDLLHPQSRLGYLRKLLEPTGIFQYLSAEKLLLDSKVYFEDSDGYIHHSGVDDRVDNDHFGNVELAALTWATMALMMDLVDSL